MSLFGEAVAWLEDVSKSGMTQTFVKEFSRTNLVEYLSWHDFRVVLK